MLTPVIVVCALVLFAVVAGGAILLWAAWRAPEGHETEQGFHEIVPPGAAVKSGSDSHGSLASQLTPEKAH